MKSCQSYTKIHFLAKITAVLKGTSLNLLKRMIELTDFVRFVVFLTFTASEIQAQLRKATSSFTPTTVATVVFRTLPARIDHGQIVSEEIKLPDLQHWPSPKKSAILLHILPSYFLENANTALWTGQCNKILPACDFSDISSRIAGLGELFSSDFQACAQSPRWATRCSLGSVSCSCDAAPQTAVPKRTLPVASSPLSEQRKEWSIFAK